MYLGMPLTTKWHNPAYHILLLDTPFKKPSFVVINQWKMFDVQRFFSRIGILSFDEFSKIKNLLRYKYFPEDS